MSASNTEKSRKDLLRENRMLRQRVALLESAGKTQATPAPAGWVEDLFYSLVDSIQDIAIFMIDPGGTVITWNIGAERLWGYTADEIVGRHFSCIFTAADVAAGAPADALQQAKREGRHSGQGWRVRKDGSQFLAEFVMTALRDRNDCLYGFARVVRDITKQEASKQEIAQLNADLERRVAERTAALAAANEELSAFSYSVSHDLRTPLRAIDGFSQAVIEDYAHTLDATGVEYLGRIRSEAQRMGELIDDLLELSRITRTELSHGEVNLSEMVSHVAKRLQQSSPNRQVEFDIAADQIAHGDARMLRIAIENLLENAWKFTSKRSDARIEFGRDRTCGDDAVWFIRDNGVGFDMAYARDLFGAFQRLHTDSEFPGSGIGLATVQRIIHRHGGRVWAEAVPDQGACFFFTI